MHSLEGTGGDQAPCTTRLQVGPVQPSSGQSDLLLHMQSLTSLWQVSVATWKSYFGSSIQAYNVLTLSTHPEVLATLGDIITR